MTNLKIESLWREEAEIIKYFISPILKLFSTTNYQETIEALMLASEKIKKNK